MSARAHARTAALAAAVGLGLAALGAGSAAPAQAAPTATTAVTAPAALTAPTASTYERISFNVEGAPVVAHHWQGTSAAPRPVVVMGHGLGGTQVMKLDEIAAGFAAAGYDVLTFDYRFWGESGGSPREVIDIDDQLADWRGAIGAARRLPGVDAGRVVLWGSSLGGGHVLTLGGENLPGVRAVVAQVPHVNGPASTLASDLANVPWLVEKGIADAGAALVGGAPVYIPIAGVPGSRALLTQPSVLPGYSQAGHGFANRVAARVALQLPFYSPDGTAARSRAATFVGVGDQDELCPPGPALDLARRMGAETHTYSGGHFDGYPGQPFGAQLFADQLDFLRRHVPVSPAG